MSICDLISCDRIYLLLDLPVRKGHLVGRIESKSRQGTRVSGNLEGGRDVSLPEEEEDEEKGPMVHWWSTGGPFSQAGGA